MSTFIRFDGTLLENMVFERKPGWETELVAHRPTEGDGTYQLELRDADGKVLVSVSPRVDFQKFCTLQDHAMRSTRVVAYLPFKPEGREMVFRRGDYEIDRDTVAADPPRVRITEVKSQPRGRVRIGWRSTHPAGKPLTYNVAYLAHAKRGFILVRGIRRTEYIADLSRFPGGIAARLAVLATDGTRSAFAVSKRINVTAKAPRVSIQAPIDRAELPADQPVTLSGLAVDIAGATLPDEFLLWRLDGEEVARGTRLALAQGLQPGEHRATLRYKPEKGVATEASVTFIVARRSRDQQRLLRLLAEGAI